MDTDDGVEVVWDKVQYSNRKIAKGSKVRYSDYSTLCCLALQARHPTSHIMNHFQKVKVICGLACMTI